MTSSTAAICYGVSEQRRVFTEADWTDPNHSDTYAYVRSKVIAERAARDFMASEGGAMEFCTINPGLVLGPVLGSDYSAPLAAVQKMLNGDLPGLPHIGFPVCHVRDIADAHICAMTQPGLNGERFLCTADTLWLNDIAAILKSRLGDQAKRVPTMRLPDFLVRLSACSTPRSSWCCPNSGASAFATAAMLARCLAGVRARPPRASSTPPAA